MLSLLLEQAACVICIILLIFWNLSVVNDTGNALLSIRDYQQFLERAADAFLSHC